MSNDIWKIPRLITHEVHRHDMFADCPAKFRDEDMFRVHGIGIQCGAIVKNGNEPGIVRAWEVEHIKACVETFDPVDHRR